MFIVSVLLLLQCVVSKTHICRVKNHQATIREGEASLTSLIPVLGSLACSGDNTTTSTDCQFQGSEVNQAPVKGSIMTRSNWWIPGRPFLQAHDAGPVTRGSSARTIGQFRLVKQPSVFCCDKIPPPLTPFPFLWVARYSLFHLLDLATVLAGGLAHCFPACLPACLPAWLNSIPRLRNYCALLLRLGLARPEWRRLSQICIALWTGHSVQCLIKRSL